MRITLLKGWPKGGEIQDGHDPTQCHCGGDFHGACLRHDGVQAFRERHAECPATFPCRTV
jgi:hypothetical protein